MQRRSYDGPKKMSPPIWACLTLAVAVATGGVITVANAQGRGPVRPDKVQHCASSQPCLQETNNGSGVGLQGNGKNGAGVTGSSSNNVGVSGYASNFAGVLGDANGAQGVLGESYYSQGVEGRSTASDGVYGQSDNSVGVGGFSTNSYGVLGQSANPQAAIAGFNTYNQNGAIGVFGTSTLGPGVTAYSSYDYALVSEGDALIEGDIYTSGSCHNGCSRTRHQMTFATSSSRPTVDDMGEATLHNGVARVPLARDFANVIDSQKPYFVMLTPEGDASLYVANRTARSFEVRQIGGGHESIAFAYRIVGKPYGARDERLPFKVTRDYSTLRPPDISHK